MNPRKPGRKGLSPNKGPGYSLSYASFKARVRAPESLERAKASIRAWLEKYKEAESPYNPENVKVPREIKDQLVHVKSGLDELLDLLKKCEEEEKQALEKQEKEAEVPTEVPQPEFPPFGPSPPRNPEQEMSFDGGGGFATLSLPDIHFGVKKEEPGGETVHKLSNDNDFGDEVGGVATANFTIPWSATTALELGGFWARIDGSDTVRCTSTLGERCTISDIVDDPEAAAPLPPADSELSQRTERNVDNWGAQAEGRFFLQTQGFLRGLYVAAGPDFRGIDQDTSIRSEIPDVSNGLYKETSRYDLLRRLCRHRRRVLVVPSTCVELRLALVLQGSRRCLRRAYKL